MTANRTKSFGHDLIHYTITYIVPMIIGFLLLPVFSEHFTTIEYGQYSLITSTLGLLGIITVNWINVAFIRFYSNSKNEGRSEQLIFSSLFMIVIVMLLLAGLLTILHYAGLLDRIIPNEYFGFVLFMLFSANMHSFLFSYLRAIRAASFSSLLGSISIISRALIFIVLLFNFEMTISGILIATISADIIYLAAILYKEREAISMPSLSKLDTGILIESLKYGSPFILILGVHWILTLSDRYMIEFLRGSSEVGIFSINYSLAQQTLMPIITIFMTTAEPIIFQKYGSSPIGEVNRTLNQVFTYFLLIIIPCTVGLSFTANDLTAIFINDDFRQGSVIIPIVAFGFLFLGVRQFLNKSLEIVKKSKEIAFISIVAAVVKIVGNFVLIPFMGYVGAAYATLIAYFVYFIASFYKSMKVSEVKIEFNLNHLKITLAAIIMGLSVKLIDFTSFENPFVKLPLKLAIGVIIYLVSIVLFNCVGNELRMVVNFIKRKFKREGKINN